MAGIIKGFKLWKPLYKNYQIISLSLKGKYIHVNMGKENTERRLKVFVNVM